MSPDEALKNILEIINDTSFVSDVHDMYIGHPSSEDSEAALAPLAELDLSCMYDVGVSALFQCYEHHRDNGRNVRCNSANILDVVEHATRRGENISVDITFRFELGSVKEAHFKGLVEKALKIKSETEAIQAEMEKKRKELAELEAKLKDVKKK